MSHYSTTYDDNMENYYTKMLLNGLTNSDMKVEDIPLIINTVDTSYPLAFIDYEEDSVLGINYTTENGKERFVVINKKYIIDIEILYRDDFNIVNQKDSEEESDVMYQ